MQIFTYLPWIIQRIKKRRTVFPSAARIPENDVYRTRITFHASARRSTLHAALAGLVDGRQTAGRPVFGSVYCR